MKRVQGKNVLFTGASSRIGQAIAIRFAQECANVAINYRRGAKQAEAKHQMVSHIPAGCAACPEEIAADVFSFPASDDASYVTRQTASAWRGFTPYPEFGVAWKSGE